MKKTLMSFLILVLAVSSFAQEGYSKKKSPTLSVNFILNDFQTASKLRASSLPSLLNNKDVARIKDMIPGFGITYYEGLSDHFDFMSSLQGSFIKYPFRSGRGIGKEWFHTQLDANVNMKLVTDDHFCVPYLTAGVGIFSHGGTYFGAYIPVGSGLQFNLGNQETFLFTQFQYRIAVTDNAAYHFNYSLGIGAPLNPKKEEIKMVSLPPKPIIIPPPAALAEKDTDGDGILDSKDKCPTVKGVAKYDGCPVPDTDKDGINDDNDKCPTVAGLAKYNGCPIPDTDGDKVNDEEDKCPTVAGLARYNGCPIPDTDGDGVNDEVDKCPTVAGPSSNNGCPLPKVSVEEKQKVEVAAKNIYFATGSATLLAKSFKSLNEVVAIMKANNDAKLVIEGHTDNVGKDAYNKTLSQKRANAVLNYLVKKGADKTRITAIGFGEEQPVEDNKTAAGRAKNRRVELKLGE